MAAKIKIKNIMERKKKQEIKEKKKYLMLNITFKSP